VRFLKNLPGLPNVSVDLGNQSLDVRKALFVTQACQEFQFDFLSIKISVEVQQVRFDTREWGLVFEGRAHAYVRYCPPGLSTNQRPANIYSGHGYGAL
jgi:hypothetical protein